MICPCGCDQFGEKNQFRGPYEFRFFSCRHCGRMADEKLLNQKGNLVAYGYVARLEFQRLERQAEIKSIN